MRAWLARWLQPDMCNYRIRIIQSYRSPDKLLPDGTIEPGATYTQAQTCGKKPGHDGEHGPWSRWYRWRTIAANWICWD